MQLIPILKTTVETTLSDQITDAEGAAMGRAILNLFRHWQVSDAEACTLLGGMSSATYSRWKRGQIGRIGTDLKTRLSLLMGIHKALRMLFTDQKRVYAWVKQPNADFNGTSALEVMLKGQITDLMRIRHYLDAVRG